MRPRNEARRDPLYLGRLMKNWSAQQSSPAGGKARLLRVASLNPTVRRKYIALAPALMHTFRRAFIDLFLHITMQSVMYSFPTERRFSCSGSYNLSQRLARNAALQSL